MSVPGLLLSLLLAAIAIIIVAKPLLRGRGARLAGDDPAQREARLRVSYERVLTNILDLDEDLATGKISQGDHHAEREIWLQRGIQLLRALDGMDGADPSPGQLREEVDLDQAIEAAVAAHREGKPAQPHGEANTRA